MKQPFFYTFPLLIMREGKTYIAYSPALDLSSAGKIEAEARRMFSEAAEAFFKELNEMGTSTVFLNEVIRSEGSSMSPNRVLDWASV